VFNHRLASGKAQNELFLPGWRLSDQGFLMNIRVPQVRIITLHQRKKQGQTPVSLLLFDFFALYGISDHDKRTLTHAV
jgi:hypothetical protein